MAFFKLRIADKNIAVTAIYDRTMDFCRDYIADFEKEDFSVVMEESDIIAEMDKTLRERELEVQTTEIDIDTLLPLKL